MGRWGKLSSGVTQGNLLQNQQFNLWIRCIWWGRLAALRAKVSPFPQLMQGAFCCLRSFSFLFRACRACTATYVALSNWMFLGVSCIFLAPKAKAQHSMLMANLNRQGYREVKLHVIRVGAMGTIYIDDTDKPLAYLNLNYHKKKLTHKLNEHSIRHDLYS